MDYIQNKLFRAIAKTKKRQDGKDSTIVGYYTVLMQYILYLMFACIWGRKEQELTRQERSDYLNKMRRASLGTILNTITALDTRGEPVLGIGGDFRTLVQEFIKPRNSEEAHGILVPGLQEESYHSIALEYEKILQEIMALGLPFFSEDCKMYYLPENGSFQATVFDSEDYDYQDLNEQVVRAMDLQPGELHYFFGGVCYKLSPFLILREIENREDPYEIYCYQEYNLQNGRFEYKRYSELEQNISFSRIYKDYFLSFQEEYSHTIGKANGVICNKYENNYDYFISTSPIDTYEQKVWQFIKSGKSNACLTIRGGGGIGKTALVQYVCNRYIFEPFRMGDIQYVIFCSAKDREFRQVSGLAGHITEIRNESMVRCYEDIIRCIGWVIAGKEEIRTEEDVRAVEERLTETDGVLLIIDDFETLSGEDKQKVVALSARLNVTRHKMIITTRSQYMAGEEYYIEGMNSKQTLLFMKERFRKSCTEAQCKAFEAFTNADDVREKIHRLTKGLPLLAIQLVNVLVLNGMDESALTRQDNEEVEDFLLGRLYSYFGTETSRVLFLIIAHFLMVGGDEIMCGDLFTMYRLICDRLHLTNVDFEEDLAELQKLNIIRNETDYVRVAGTVSPRIIRQCQEELMKDGARDPGVFENQLFRSIREMGMRDGILSVFENEKTPVDAPFVRLFALENLPGYTNDIRFSILEKYIAGIAKDAGKAEEFFLESGAYFDAAALERQFAIWSRKYGFLIPGLPEDRDLAIREEETSAEYYLQEIISAFNEQIDAIDEYLANRKGASQSYRLDMEQTIRGRLGSICNVRLAKVLAMHPEGCRSSLLKVKEIMDEISFSPEFDIRENEQYRKLEELLKALPDL